MRRCLPSPPNCTHAGNCADSTISTCSVCWRSAGFRNPSLDEARSSFARLSTVFTRTRNRHTSRNFSAKIRCAEPATLISRRSRTGVKGFGNCGPDRSLGFPWNWASLRSSPPSCGTISSWAVVWPTCPFSPATPDRCLTMRRFRFSQTDRLILARSQLFQQLHSDLSHLRVILFFVRYGQPFFNVLARVLFPSHLDVDVPQFDIMNEAVGINFDRL